MGYKKLLIIIYRKIRRRSIFIKIFLILFFLASIASAKNHYPPFSWDKIPLYLHFGKDRTLSDEELKTAAQLCDFIGLEKGHGM